MAFYEDEYYVKKTDKPDQYKTIRKIGEKPPSPGIYKCQKCGFEDVMNRDCDKLPPCANCKEEGSSNTWKLLVKATNK
jgi:hypothetical protein